MTVIFLLGADRYADGLCKTQLSIIASLEAGDEQKNYFTR